MKLKIYISLLLALLFSVSVKAQDVAFKTNLLYDATATINAGIEFPVARQWTVDVSGNYNDWDMSHDRKWKHWMVQPEARYWFCDRFIGHFVGFHLHGGKYNIGIWTMAFSSWEPTFPNFPMHAIRDGSWAVASDMAIHGY